MQKAGIAPSLCMNIYFFIGAVPSQPLRFCIPTFYSLLFNSVIGSF